MPSSKTITAFNVFASGGLIRASEHNENWANLRGHIIPMHPSTATAGTSGAYDLGDTDKRWGTVYCDTLDVTNPVGGSGSGVGAQSYFTTIDLSTGTTNISTYDDTGAYVDGTGGSPTVLTIARNTTTPLDADGDLKISKAASDGTGEGVTLLSDTIDNADLGRKLWVSFEWDGTDANYTSGDLEINVYDVTNSATIPFIPVSGFEYTSSTGVSALPNIATRVLGYFTPKSTTASVRVSLHLTSDSATGAAWDCYLARPKLSPDADIPGAICTRWKNAGTMTIEGVTSNPTKGTTEIDQVWWRRVGRCAEIKFIYLAGAGGAAGSGAYKFKIPSEIGVISSEVVATATAGTGNLSDQAAASLAVGGSYGVDASSSGTVVYAYAYDTQYLCVLASSSGTNNYHSNAFYALSTNNLAFTIHVLVPINGWEDSAQLSTTEVGLMTAMMRASGDPASAASGAPVIFPTSDYDTHNWYSVSTGLYTVKRKGKYRVHGFITSANTAVQLSAAVNGTAQIVVGQTDSNGECAYSGTVTVNAGDTIGLEPNNTLDAASGSTLCIEEVPDFTIFTERDDSDDVELYLNTPGTTTAGWGSSNTVIRRYTATKKSTGNGVYYTYADSSTAGMSVTIKIPGLYSFEVSDSSSSGASSIGISLNVSGTITTAIAGLSYASGFRSIGYAGTANELCSGGGITLRLSAGDVVRAHGDGSMNNTTERAYFQMIRIGK